MTGNYKLVNRVTRKNSQARHRKCADCGALMEGRRQAYHYTECGLSKVKLKNILVFECACGVRIPEIPAIGELHTFIMLDILSKKSLLSGEEIRFLRKMAGLTQAELAEIIGVEKSRPSKWESSRPEEEIGKENDRVLRSCCFFGMVQQVMSATGEEAVNITKAHREMLRKLDIKELFKAIKNLSSGPKDMSYQNNIDENATERWSILTKDQSIGEQAVVQ